MPTVTETNVAGYVSCPDAVCPGYAQEQVDVVRREQQFSYVELGGDLPGTERSMIDPVRACDPADADCPHCGRLRIASLDARPEYPRTSGQDPLRLLNLTADKQVRDMQISGLERDRDMADLKAMLAEQRARIAELEARPRGPGRSRKPDDTDDAA